MLYRFMLLALLISSPLLFAQNLRGLPSLPKSSGGSGGIGLTGSVGIGFADFTTLTPAADHKLDRGTYVNTSIERGFDVMHLYLTLGFNYMDAKGVANYSYTNLSSSHSYSLTDISFGAKTYELALGLKLKLIDDYWFRPYAEGGGLGSYNEVSYSYSAANLTTLNGIGNDYKTKDVIMGSGYYYEGGVELMFTDKFGVKLSARQTIVQTKKLETLGDRVLRLRAESYYFSALFGF